MIEAAEATVSEMMFDHPGWQVAKEGSACRATRIGASVWTVTVKPVPSGVRVRASQVAGPKSRRPSWDVVDSTTLTGTHPVTGVLRQAGAVARLRNPDLWDALATALLRQVIRAAQARRLHRAFSRHLGEQVITPAGPAWLFPTPQVVLSLTDEEWSTLGMTFQRRPLRAAAQAYLDFGSEWAGLGPDDLLVEVQRVPRIGPWTAGAAVADATNDFALYPFADLAVRTWAARLTPSHRWPDSEPEFARAWRRSAGSQLSTWTLLTLAFGAKHARAGVH